MLSGIDSLFQNKFVHFIRNFANANYLFGLSTDKTFLEIPTKIRPSKCCSRE